MVRKGSRVQIPKAAPLFLLTDDLYFAAVLGGCGIWRRLVGKACYNRSMIDSLISLVLQVTVGVSVEEAQERGVLLRPAVEIVEEVDGKGAMRQREGEAFLEGVVMLNEDHVIKDGEVYYWWMGEFGLIPEADPETFESYGRLYGRLYG